MQQPIEIVRRSPQPLSRDEIAALCDLDRACCGPSERGFLWWRGVVAEDAELPPRRQAVMNFSAAPRESQRYIVGGAAWRLSERLPDGKRQWRLLTVFVEKRYRMEGIATSLLNSTPLDISDYEVIADVAERDTATQLVLRRCGWHGLPLTKLDGHGTIRFRADFAGCPALATPPQQPPVAKPKRKRKPPPQPVGAKSK